MRIVLLAFHFAEYTSALALALAAHHDVLLVLNRENFESEVGRLDVFAGHPHLHVRFISRSTNPMGIVQRAAALVQLVRGFRPDVLHCQEDTRDYLALALPFLGRMPMVLTVHDPRPHSGLDAQRRKRSRHGAYQRQMRQRADAVIVHGDLLVSDAEQEIPRLRGAIHALPHGPLGLFFGSSASTGTSWQAGSCLFFGRIEQYKGLPFFVDAIRMLHRDGVAVQGVIAGRGTQLDLMKPDLIGDPAFRVIDRFLSPQEVHDCFVQANVVVVPYLDATQSGVVAYAFGLGRPVVATRVGGLPEVVHEDVNGLLVPPGDAAALAAALRTVITDQALSTRMASASAVLGLGELSWPIIAERTVGVYERLLPARTSGAATHG